MFAACASDLTGPLHPLKCFFSSPLWFCALVCVIVFAPFLIQRDPSRPRACDGPHLSACAQVRGGPVRGSYQPEAAVHPDAEPGQRRPGFPAGGEDVQRRLRLGPRRRPAGPAAPPAEAAGELRQYLHRLPVGIMSGFLAES